MRDSGEPVGRPIDVAQGTGAPSSKPAEGIVNAKEAARLLGITTAKLARYLKDLRLEVPRSMGGLRISSTDLEALKAHHNQNSAEPTEEVFNAKDAARLLGITGAKLARYLKDLRLEIPRSNGGLQITRADIEVLRIYHKNRADGPRVRESQEAREFSEALKEYGRIFRSLRKLTTHALKLEQRLRKALPPGLAVIHTLPESSLVLKVPLTVTIVPNGHRFRATFPEADLEGIGATRHEALLELRKEIVRAYERFARGLFFHAEDREHFGVLKVLIASRPSSE